MLRPSSFKQLFELYQLWNAKMRSVAGFDMSLVAYIEAEGYHVPPHLLGKGPVDLLNGLAVHWDLTNPVP